MFGVRRRIARLPFPIWAAASLGVHAAVLVAMTRPGGTPDTAPLLAGDTFDIQGLGDPGTAGDEQPAAPEHPPGAASPPRPTDPATADPGGPTAPHQARPAMTPFDALLVPATAEAARPGEPPAEATAETAPAPILELPETPPPSTPAPRQRRPARAGRSKTGPPPAPPGEGPAGEPGGGAPALFGAAGDRTAADLATAFTRGFPQVASADPVWVSAPFGSAGSADLTLTLDAAGHITGVTVSPGASPALAQGIRRTVALIRGRVFTAKGAVTHLHLRATVSPDTVHDGLHGDVFAIGGSFAHSEGSAFFALAIGRRVDLRVTAR